MIRETVDQLNDYLNSEINKKLVSVSNVVINDHQILVDYLTDDIIQSIMIASDKYPHAEKIDSLSVRKAVSAVQKAQVVEISEDHLEAFSVRLYDFFAEESEVVIEDENIINNINETIITDLRGKVLPDKNTLRQALISCAPTSVLSDEEGIDATVFSLLTMTDDFINNEIIMQGVSDIVAQLPAELHNQTFKDEIRDLLVVLTENSFLVPSKISQDISNKSEPVSLEITQTGMPLIFTHFDDSLMKSQLQSLSIAIFLVILILIIQMRSFIGGLIAVFPILLTLLLNFALMSYLNIPLDIATILVSSIAIGIGIDYTIHFTNRMKLEMSRHDSVDEALAETLRTTGKAILINALSVAAGFLVLMFAELIPIQRFGWLTAATMIFSSFGAITFLPALILLSKAKFWGNVANNNLIKTDSLKIKINDLKNNGTRLKKLFQKRPADS